MIPETKCPKCGAGMVTHGCYSSPHPTGPNRRARLGDIDCKILSWDACPCGYRSATRVSR